MEAATDRRPRLLVQYMRSMRLVKCLGLPLSMSADGVLSVKNRLLKCIILQQCGMTINESNSI